MLCARRGFDACAPGRCIPLSAGEGPAQRALGPPSPEACKTRARASFLLRVRRMRPAGQGVRGRLPQRAEGQGLKARMRGKICAAWENGAAPPAKGGRGASAHPGRAQNGLVRPSCHAAPARFFSAAREAFCAPSGCISPRAGALRRRADRAGEPARRTGAFWQMPVRSMLSRAAFFAVGCSGSGAAFSPGRVRQSARRAWRAARRAGRGSSARREGPSALPASA